MTIATCFDFSDVEALDNEGTSEAERLAAEPELDEEENDPDDDDVEDDSDDTD